MKPGGPIVITGFMGCGKTEIARALARRFDLAAIDLDQKIAQQYGRTAAQLIVDDGEPAFRTIETATLRELLQSEPTSVIALGGGAWITDENRQLIAAHGGLTVWLDVPFAVCWQRIVAATEDRPLGRTREQAKQLYRRRRPIYQLADLHIVVRGDERVSSLVARIESDLPNYRGSN